MAAASRVGRVRVPLLLCLAAALWPAPARGDEHDESARPDGSAQSVLQELFQLADAVIVGRPVEAQHSRVSKFAVPATRYTFSNAVDLKGDPERRRHHVWVLGGPDPTGKVLLLSRAQMRLERDQLYLVYAKQTEQGLLLFDAHRIDPDGALVSRSGHWFGIDQQNRPVWSGGRRDPIQVELTSGCRPPSGPDASLPANRDGLTAQELRSDEPRPEGRVEVWFVGVLRSLGLNVDFAPQDVSDLDDFLPAKGRTGWWSVPKLRRPWIAKPILLHVPKRTSPADFARVQAAAAHWNQGATWLADKGGIFRVVRSLRAWKDQAAFHQDRTSGIAFVKEGDIPRPRRGRARYSLAHTECRKTCDGICFFWTERSGRLVEADILINRRVAGIDRQEAAQVVHHELGHALTLGHECGFLSVMLDTQDFWYPPYRRHTHANYVHLGDLACLRLRLQSFNKAAGRRVWSARKGSDVAVVSACQVGSWAGCRATLTMIEGRGGDSSVRVSPGQRLRLRGVTIENLGTSPARDVVLTFALWSRDRNQESVAATYRLSELRTWKSATYEIEIPDVVAGTYWLVWRIRARDHVAGDANDATYLQFTGQDPQPPVEIVVSPNPSPE